MKKFSVIICFVFVFFSGLNAQSQKPLLIVNGEEIFAEEFMAVFMKNNINKTASKEEIDEYLELYINFRLKVAEAKTLQLDTQKTFKIELDGYRKTLAQPYLMKTEVLDKLVNEAFERMQWDVRASHILIKVSPFASPADTLKAYNKAISIRNRVLKGESFEKLAVEVSDDESAKGSQGPQPMAGNKGDLGYFSALDLVYDFENAAYAMKVGDVSMPVRSEYGYHIIKLTDKKKSLGKVQTAHILISIPSDADETVRKDAKNKADDLYDKIVKGDSFEDLAKEFSDDRGSGMRGGMLPWFGVFRMLPEFIEPLYSMAKGDVSKPVLTSYGYHIIKLVDKKTPGSFDETKSDLKTRVMRDQRFKTATKSFVEKLKVENGFESYPVALKAFISIVNDSIFKGTWSAEMVSEMKAPLFKTGDMMFYQQDFAFYVESNQLIQKGDDKETYLRNLYDKFVQEMVIQYENDILEQKHPQFASLMKEYHDGILLFDLTDQMVWSKALKDSAGLSDFYETIKLNYMWPERVEGTIYSVNDPVTAGKFHKLLSKAIKKGTDVEAIMETFNTPENILITEETGIYIKSGHPVFEWVKSVGLNKPYEKDGKHIIVRTTRIIQPEPKALREVKGVVTNEYQNYLEKEWIKTLRSKYSWKVNNDVLQSLYR